MWAIIFYNKVEKNRTEERYGTFVARASFIQQLTLVEAYVDVHPDKFQKFRDLLNWRQKQKQKDEENEHI